MHRQTLIACLPYIAAIVALLILQLLVVRLCGATFQLKAITRLHRDERGAVQSLSFVLTLPVFMAIMMFVVQLTLITMARISVEYSAFAAARSAIVWFPANLGHDILAENRVGPAPLIYVRTYDSGGRTFSVYQIPPTGDKFAHIHLAAAMACMNLSPSVNTGVSNSHPSNAALPSIQAAYEVMAPASLANTRIPARLRNKLAYALANTQVEIEIHHCGDCIQGGDPPLYHELNLEQDHPARYLWPNEIGWQDQVFVTVHHRYALLPGPGRLLASRDDSPEIYDEVADQIELSGNVYTRTLSATVRMGNEGQIPTGTIPTPDPRHPETYVQPLPWK